MKKEDDPLFEDDEAPAWILTYADLMSLLLVFFILLFTLSKLTEHTLESALSSIQTAISSKGTAKKDPSRYSAGGDQIVQPIKTTPSQGKKPIETPQSSDSDEKNLEAEEQAQAIAKEVNVSFKAYKLGKEVSATSDGEKIIIRVDGQALFDSGTAEINWDAEFIMDTLLNLFKKYADYNINIKGHTDNLPIKTARFPSNWELSAIRATTILRFFLENGISPERMTATGYADSIPLVPNNTPANRAKNRRAEFVLERGKNR